MKSGVTFKSVFDSAMFVDRVIVYDQMQIEVGWGLSIDQFQKFDPFLVAMAIHAGHDDAPFGHLQRSEQSGGPMSFIVVSHGYRSPFDQGQPWLGSVQR